LAKLKKGFRTSGGHTAATNTELFGSIRSCSEAECSVPAGCTLMVQHVRSPGALWCSANTSNCA